MKYGTTKPPAGTKINWGHPLAKGLVGCWNFNEGSGDRVYDATGKYGPGVLKGTTGKPAWERGPFGPQLSFASANNQYVEITHNPAYPLAFPNGAGNPDQRCDLTYQLKFYMNSLRNFNGLFTKTVTNTTRPFETYVLADGTLRAQFGNSGINPTTILAGATWYDMVISQGWSRTLGVPAIRIYLNGNFVGEYGGATDWGIDTGTMMIGQRDDQIVALDGKVAFARLWQARALRAEEVRLLYAQPYCFMAEGSMAATYLAAAPTAVTQPMVTIA